jgi:hypothetical protein
MAELEEEVTLDIAPKFSRFRTEQNGDEIIISHLDLTAEQAASVAWLVNRDEVLEMQLKVKG